MQINHCLRCNHQWPSKLHRAITCSKCRSPYWDVPKGTKAAVPSAIEITNTTLPEVTGYNRFDLYDKVQTKLDPEYQPKKMQTIEELRNMIASKQPHESVLPNYSKVETDDVTIDYGEI